MRDYTFSKYGANYSRISKPLARNLYNAGFPVVLCACNLRPEMFGSQCVPGPNGSYNFENLCNEFEFYRCTNSEEGKYIAFYAPENYFYHFEFTDDSNPFFGRANTNDIIKIIRKWNKKYNIKLKYSSDNNGAYFELSERSQ